MAMPPSIAKVLDRAKEITSHSWECGALSEALLELFNPELSVFADDPFPSGRLPMFEDGARVPGLSYARQHIVRHGPTLADAEGQTCQIRLRKST